MSRQQTAQPLEAPDVDFARAAHAPHSVGQFRVRELRTCKQLADLYPIFGTARAAREWVHRHDLPIYRYGRRVVVDLRDVDRALRGQRGL